MNKEDSSIGLDKGPAGELEGDVEMESSGEEPVVGIDAGTEYDDSSQLSDSVGLSGRELTDADLRRGSGFPSSIAAAAEPKVGLFALSLSSDVLELRDPLDPPETVPPFPKLWVISLKIFRTFIEVHFVKYLRNFCFASSKDIPIFRELLLVSQSSMIAIRFCGGTFVEGPGAGEFAIVRNKDKHNARISSRFL